MDVDDDDQLFRLRIRQAISIGGGPAKVSSKSGIPVSTLNKYIAMSSVPSFTKAAKIADASGLALDRLAYGIEGPDAAVDILREVYSMVREMHQEQGIVLPPVAMAKLVEDAYQAISFAVIDKGNRDEIVSCIEKYKLRVARDLTEARNSPGSGKRSA